MFISDSFENKKRQKKQQLSKKYPKGNLQLNKVSMNFFNNYNYDVIIVYEDSLQTRKERKYNLQYNFNKDIMIEQIPSEDSFIVNISFNFRQRFYHLNEKNEINQFYQNLHYKVDICLDFIKTSKRTKKLVLIEYINNDCQFDLLDKFLNWMMQSNITSLTQFIFSTSTNLSNQQFSQFNKLITERLKNLSSLETNFKYFGQMEENKKVTKQNNLKTFDCNLITSKEQLYCLRQFPKLDQLKVNFYSFQVYNIDQILPQIIITQQSLTCLKLYFDKQIIINKKSLKLIEKFTHLTQLLLYCNYCISKDDLDISKLKNLSNLSLDCSEPIHYLNSIGNNEHITQISLVNQKNKIIPKGKLGKIKNLISFSYQFSCNKREYQQQLINELAEIKKIAFQLQELKLDFSNCIYFQNQQMSDDTINLIGQIFQNSSEETKIHLITKKCTFTQQKRLDLSLKFQLIPNIALFQLNDFQMVDELIKRYSNYLSTLFFDVRHAQLPYLYGTLSAFKPFFDKTFEIKLNECFQLDQIKNLDDLKKYSSLFANFKRFLIKIQFNGINQIENVPKILLNILPKNTTFLELNYQTSQNQILSLIESFKKLKILECKTEDIELFPFDVDIFNQKSRRRIQLNLRINYSGVRYFDELYNLFKIKGYFINITLQLYSNVNKSIFKNIFNLINQSEYRILVQFSLYISNSDEDEPSLMINEYCNEIAKEKQKMYIFKQLIMPQLNINPNMVYADFYYD